MPITPPITDSPLDIDALLQQLIQVGGSDLHLSVTEPPRMRIHGELIQVPNALPLTSSALTSALLSLLTADQKDRMSKDLGLDMAYTPAGGTDRFRVNMFRQQGAMSAVFRMIASEIKSLESLGMPATMYGFAGLPRGIVLITGPTGSGKTTTLAALIDYANRTRADHILTIEDPIEFIHKSRKSLVNQREVGEDVHSFDDALRAALREDPDILLVGELRDLDTIKVALTAAETGHLVFATLHTQSAIGTISRIIDVFPAAQQAQIRTQLASTLQAVVCQSLIRRADGKGRVVASEIMTMTTSIGQKIRTGTTQQIRQDLEMGSEFGMRTLNQHLAELVTKDLITRSVAEAASSEIKDLAGLLDGANSRKKAVSPTLDTSIDFTADLAKIEPRSTPISH